MRYDYWDDYGDAHVESSEKISSARDKFLFWQDKQRYTKPPEKCWLLWLYSIEAANYIHKDRQA